MAKDYQIKERVHSTIATIGTISHEIYDYNWKAKLKSYVNMENHLFVVENFDFYIFAFFYFIQKNLIYSHEDILVFPHNLILQLLFDVGL